MDVKKVNAVTLRKLIEATLKHLGGKLLPGGGELVAEFETNLCGKITLALTKTPSRAESFKDLGCRVYFRGVQRKQQGHNQVQAWMREVVVLTRI